MLNHHLSEGPELYIDSILSSHHGKNVFYPHITLSLHINQYLVFAYFYALRHKLGYSCHCDLSLYLIAMGTHSVTSVSMFPIVWHVQYYLLVCSARNYVHTCIYIRAQDL